ncbi:hypothetical protein HNR77_005396 [Paenibacillus sp. JGP012]|uniref:hypothetical protein n=1 Tax=Paenibacillus sp. JGP012 TaxID=2735914 RepID=UPI0016193A14|nr:hypothetical protein [Paenibacillus sp. JGP012]MBB6024288.1 hypothetical protein [Paenibacillus sp. JGP012]
MREEKDELINFVKECKNAYLSKMNNSTFKMSTLVFFLTGSLIWFINTIPTSKPTFDQYYVLLISCTVFLNIVVLGFDLINRIFRRNLVEKNIYGELNKLERQYMKPIYITTFIFNILWILLLISSSVIMFFFSHKLWFLALPNILVIKLAFMTLINCLIPLFNNYTNYKIPVPNEAEESNKKYSFAIVYYNLLPTSVLIYYLLCFMLSDFFFEYKKTVLFSLYLTGGIVSILLIAREWSNKIIYSWLEDLYIAIYMKNLSYSQIKKILKENFSTGRNIETMVYTEDD